MDGFDEQGCISDESFASGGERMLREVREKCCANPRTTAKKLGWK
jgi:hypothetical protein